VFCFLNVQAVHSFFESAAVAGIDLVGTMGADAGNHLLNGNAL
jgi:hypothetical protein